MSRHIVLLTFSIFRHEIQLCSNAYFKGTVALFILLISLSGNNEKSVNNPIRILRLASMVDYLACLRDDPLPFVVSLIITVIFSFMGQEKKGGLGE